MTFLCQWSYSTTILLIWQNSKTFADKAIFSCKKVSCYKKKTVPYMENHLNLDLVTLIKGKMLGENILK